MMNRRAFLSQLAAVPAASLLSGATHAATTPALSEMAPSGSHFDLAEAQRVLRSFTPDSTAKYMAIGLDYVSYSDAGLEFFLPRVQSPELLLELDFHHLTPAGAAILSRHAIGHLIFRQLGSLDFASAECFKWSNAVPGADFHLAAPITAAVARLLAFAWANDQLHLRLPELGYHVAAALSSHAHELYIDTPTLHADAAEMLSMHSGYLVHISVPEHPSAVVMQALTEYTNKHVSVIPGVRGGFRVLITDKNDTAD